MSEQPDPVEPKSSSGIAHELHWAALAVPLAVAMIFAVAGLVSFWLDLLT